MRLLFLSLSIFLLLALPSLVAAETNDNAFVLGQQQFAAGNYDQAYDLFMEAFLADPTNLDISFLLGRAAYEKGDYESALMAFERVLMMKPDAQRVKLELARTNLKLGSREMAKQYFREVLATNPPEAVWKNIEGILAAIEAGEKNNFFNGIFSAGYNWDSNASGTPSKDKVYVYGLPFAINQEKMRDHYYNGLAVLNHIYRFQDTPYSWKTATTLYGNFYENQNIYDSAMVSVNTGPVKQQDNYMLEAHLSLANVDTAYQRYLGSYGLGSSLTLLVNRETILNFSAALQDRNYYQDGARDSINYSVGAGVIFNKGMNRLTFSGGLEKEHAAADYNRYHRFVIDSRYDRQLPDGYSAYAGLRFQVTGYEGKRALFGKCQEDQAIDYSLGLSKLLWRSPQGQRSLALQLSNTYTVTDSNIGLYAYRKNVTSATFSLAF